MLQHLIQNSDFSALLRLVSPQFFRVVPMLSLLSIGKNILENTSKWNDRLPEIRTATQPLSTERLLLNLDTLPSSTETSPLSLQKDGEEILELYFRQILASETWLLDFRSSRFQKKENGVLVWTPGPYALTLSPEFTKAVRALYAGFYLGDTQSFESALRTLGVSGARQTLEKHFGLDGQTAVVFNLADFERTFAEAFESCAASGDKISPEFAALGLMLLTLYENLGTLNHPLDVRAAFHRAYSSKMGSSSK